MPDKPIYWIGSSRDDICDFPEDARKKAGFQLRAMQRGEKTNDFKSMPTIGKGVEEIRIWAEGTYRIFYVSRFSEAIYILHAFCKKTQKTSQQDIDLGKQRYQQMMKFRENL
jgi:phage-related protein